MLVMVRFARGIERLRCWTLIKKSIRDGWVWAPRGDSISNSLFDVHQQCSVTPRLLHRCRPTRVTRGLVGVV